MTTQDTASEAVNFLDASLEWVTQVGARNIFRGYRPEGEGIPNRVVLVNVTPGGQQPLALGGNGYSPIYENPGLQIQTRSKYFDESMADATEIMQLLAAIAEQDLDGTRWHSCIPRDMPVVLERDSADRIIHVVNFSVYKQVTA